MAEKLSEPFTQLLDLDRRSRLHAFGLPQQVEVKETWDGIGFRLGKFKLLFSSTDVRELLEYPRLTRVPGSKSWVMGIANVRGNLLPILDLNGYIFAEAHPPGPRARVIMVQHDNIQAGFLVDEILGMHHFLEEEYVDELPGFSPALEGYLTGYYQREDEGWGVLSLDKLIENPEFMQVAA